MRRAGGRLRNKSQTLRGLIVLLIAAFAFYEFYCVGKVIWYGYHPVTTSAYIESESARLGRVDYRPVPLNRISTSMIQAAVAAEDFDFAKHHGIDWDATYQAFISNVLEGESAPGGSTISQQTVKNLFLSHEKSYFRKGQEIFLTLVMETTWSKGRIIETYLNIAEFGEGIFGVEAAARHYYQKSAALLNPWESAWLAAILTNPKYYEKRGTTPWLAKRISIIMKTVKNYEIRRLNNRLP